MVRYKKGAILEHPMLIIESYLCKSIPLLEQ